MQTQLVGYEFKKKGLPTDKNIAVENSKVSNDYFWKTNEYTDKDVFGRTLNLTSLINKPDGYLKGSLSNEEDVDYFKFNIAKYRALSFVKETYNKDITITLDHIPEGCDYEMVLYDEEGNQVGIGKDNGNVSLYDKERCICDLIRNKDKIEMQLYSQAMKEYFKGKSNPRKLLKYSKLFKIEDKVRAYMEVLM